ncbi:hypothetical protein Rs2_16368 [Raphanus sativus]|nr:hypothetical protein Rs2_16368 [Raphanus sativus]
MFETSTEKTKLLQTFITEVKLHRRFTLDKLNLSRQSNLVINIEVDLDSNSASLTVVSFTFVTSSTCPNFEPKYFHHIVAPIDIRKLMDTNFERDLPQEGRAFSVGPSIQSNQPPSISVGLLDPLPTTPALQFTTRRAQIDRETKPEPLNLMLSATNHQPFNPSLLYRSLDESVLLDVSSQNDDAAWTEEMARWLRRMNGGHDQSSDMYNGHGRR